MKVNDEEFVAAYLTAPELNLALWEKRRVRVNGTRYWVRGWRRPLITVRKSFPRGEDETWVGALPAPLETGEA